VLAGCGAAGTSSASPDAGGRLTVTPPSVAVIPKLDTVQGLTLPSEAYKPAAAVFNLVADAQQKVTADCMRQYGFALAQLPDPVPVASQTARLYGVSDLATAQRYGYHLPSSAARDRALQQRAAGGASYSPSELLVLSGSATGDQESARYQGKQIPVGGCQGQARRQVTGADDIDPTHLADTIAVVMWQKSQSDPRVVTVVKSWSACMNQGGYHYPSPVGVTDPRWSLSGPVAEVEIQTAVTDVKCKQRTNLIGVWFTIESGYERQAIQQNIEQLTQIKNQWTAAARNAAQILGRPVQPS
jgi:hypothetical protein